MLLKKEKKKVKVLRADGSEEGTPEQQRLRTEEGGGEEAPMTREEKLQQWEDKLRQKAQELKAVKVALEKRTADIESRSAMIEEAAKGVTPEEGGPIPEGVHHNIPDRATLEELETHKSKAEQILAHIGARIEEAREKEERLLHLSSKLEEYKELGYAVTKFDGLDRMAPEDALQLFAEFEKGVEALKGLEDRLEQLAEQFPEVVDGLRPSLKDVDAIGRIGKSITEMEARLKDEKERFRTKLANYRAEGLDVTVLEEAIDHDMKTMVKEFSIFDEMVGRLKVVKQKLDSLDPLFDKEITELREQMRYPELLPDIEARVETLEDKEENKKREFLEKLRIWQEGGFEVTRLENISSGNLAFIDLEFKKFDQDVKVLEDIKARIARLDVDGKEAVLALMVNPDNIAAVRKGFAELEARARSGVVEAPAAAAAPRAAEASAKGKPSLEDRRKLIEDVRRKRLEEEKRRKDEEDERVREEREQAAARASAAAAAEEPAAPSAPEAPTTAAGRDAGAGGVEQDPATVEVTREMEMTEAMIAEAKDKGKDVNSANNLLRLARSFLRSKNYDKALQYATRSHKMVSDMLGK